VSDLAPSEAALALSCADRLLHAGSRGPALLRLHAQFAKAASDEYRFRVLDMVVSDAMHPTDEELASFGADVVARYRADRATSQAETERARVEEARLRAAQAQADERAQREEAARKDGTTTTNARSSWPEPQCITAAGAPACGYDCRSLYGQVRCAHTPFGACAAEYGKIVCWDPPARVIDHEESLPKAECTAQYGQIVCGYHCLALYGTIKCTASPRGACAAASGEIDCIDP
jgi:hypothetical protein